MSWLDWAIILPIIAILLLAICLGFGTDNHDDDGRP